MAIYRPTPGFKGRTCKVCVLTRWDFNFCVRSSPLRGKEVVAVRLLPAVLSDWDFSRGKFGLLSPGKASYDRVAIPNLRRTLGVLVFLSINEL